MSALLPAAQLASALSAPAGVGLIGMPFLEPGRRVQLDVPAGTRILEMIALVLPGATDEQRQAVRVYIDGNLVYPDFYRVRPKPGTLVVIRQIPTGSGLRIALQIAVMVAAFALGGPLGNALAQPLIAVFGSAAGGVVSAVVTGGLMFTGNLLLNALVPQPRGDSGAQSPTYRISGWRNTENPDSPVPVVMGFHRMAPQIASGSYTEVVGDEQYIRFLMHWGYGPLDISNIRIGDTPIDKFKGVEYELRQGYPDDPPVTLYPEQVVEELMSVELRRDEPGTYPDATGEIEPQIRRTQRDITHMSIDITLPNGLGLSTDEGNLTAAKMIFRIEYQEEGSSTWLLQGDYTIFLESRRSVLRTYKWAAPTRGPAYDIQVSRISYNYNHGKRLEAMQWTAIRSYRPEYPLNFQKPLALIAGRIKASKQLNGLLDTLSADVKRICPDWDAATGTWIERPTNWPASLLRFAWQGPHVARPKTDAQIDLEVLQDFHDFCVAKGLHYNRVVDYETTQKDLLDRIAAAGRAIRSDDGSKVGVIIDRPRTHIIAPVSPINSWGFEWQQDSVDLPDGYRVAFLDETDNYRSAERIIPWIGFVGEPQRVEDLSAEGKTHPADVYLFAYRRMLEVIHRPDRMSAMQDWAHFEVARGDLVSLSHYTLSKQQVSSVVKTVSGSAFEITESLTMEPATVYAARFFRPDIGTFLRTLAWRGDEASVFRLDGVGPLPQRDDIVFLGPVDLVDEHAIVSRIERTKNSSARLHFLRHAPEIDALLDAVVVPAWNGRVGDPAGEDDTAPGTPLMSVLSGRRVYDGEDYPPEGIPTILVMLVPGTESVAVADYEVEHRPSGDPDWLSAPVDSGAATIEGEYGMLEPVEIRARAISTAGIVGAWTASITHIVGGEDAGGTAPDLVVDLAVSLSGGAPRLTWVNPNDVNFDHARVRRGPAGSPFFSATNISTSLFGAPNAAMSFTDTSTGSGDWDYWVISRNSLGATDGAAGPVTITVT
ncbi:MAG TPA: hypothetical protein VLA00_14530 [Xanthobacteraceae bacterium]|nr:hypothetical protein [Xanthobacteraceae bacterium]